MILGTLLILPGLALGPAQISGHEAVRIQIIAHRGAGRTAPENTLPAIRRSLELGIPIIEVDVRVSRDGRVILLHDSRLDRTTNGPGNARQLAYSEIQKFDAGVKFSPDFAGTRVPLLEEAILLVRGKAALYLDLKVQDYVRIVEVVRRYEFSQSTYYRPYTMQGVHRLKELDPEARVVLQLGPLLKRRERLFGVLDRYDRLVLSMDLERWDQESLTFARQRKIPFFINVLGGEAPGERLSLAIEMAPAGIQTDHPGELRKLLKRKAGGR